MWNVESSDEYDNWFLSLDDQAKEAVLERVYLLQEFGPELGRPFADTLKGSRLYSNMKELRCHTRWHELRVSYYFDPNRNAYLLTGGDKKGINEIKFYKKLIGDSETIIEKHERD